MEKSTHIFIKRVVSLSLIFAMLSGIVGVGNFSINAKNNGGIKDYVIVAKNEKAYNKVLNTIDEEVVENVENLADNNIIVAELSEQEAGKLNEDSNIIVEEDLVLEASKVKPGSKSKKQLYEELEKADRIKKENTKSEWNLQAINVDNVDINTNKEQKTKVAVLDSGVDFIAGVNLVETVNFVENEDNITVWYQDLTGHGTSIASVIAGDGENVVQGVNPNVDLYSVKVLDKNNQAPISRIVQGIYWCIENDINIINMSFGTATYSKTLEKAVKDAYKANILMVAAAGNHNSNVEYPAAFEEVMAVAATDTESEISDFSNVGEELDVAAPGEKVRVLGFFGLNGVTHGTSIAVPHVVGVASLLWEKDMSKSNEFIRQLITYSSKDISNTNDCGLLDAGYALQIYDDFEKKFTETDFVTEESIPENNELAETFDEIEDDLSYVEGRWWSSGDDKKEDDHKDLAEYGARKNGITDATILAILKAGAIYPDRKDSGMNGGTTDNPQYHGGFKDAVGDDVNYIACYEFITRIALKNGNASSITNHNTIYGLGKDNYDWIKADFTGNGVGWLTWSQIFSGIKVNGTAIADTNEHRKYFTWGIALHILGDTFAHKTYRKSDKKLIVHGTPNSSQITGADNPNVVKGRWEAAKLAIKSSIECLLINDYGDFNEIVYALKKQPVTNNAQLFLKKRLSKYVDSNGGTVSKYVKNANID